MEGLHILCHPYWLILRDAHKLFMYFPCIGQIEGPPFSFCGLCPKSCFYLLLVIAGVNTSYLEGISSTLNYILISHLHGQLVTLL